MDKKKYSQSVANMIPFNIIILASAFGALFPFTVADFDGNKEVGFYIYTRYSFSFMLFAFSDRKRGMSDGGKCWND